VHVSTDTRRKGGRQRRGCRKVKEIDKNEVRNTGVDRKTGGQLVEQCWGAGDMTLLNCVEFVTKTCVFVDRCS
jgi:hypothetical protein